MTDHRFVEQCLTEGPTPRPSIIPVSTGVDPQVDLWVGMASSVAIEGYSALPHTPEQLEKEAAWEGGAAGAALAGCYRAWRTLPVDQRIDRAVLETLNRVVRNGAGGGQWRTVTVHVMRGREVVYTAPPPERVPEMMELFVEWLTRWDDHPLAAWWAHFVLVSIHPWEDGNGRTARLVEAHLLRKQNLGGWWASTRGNWPHRPAYYRTLGDTRHKQDLKAFYAHQQRMRRDAPPGTFHAVPFALRHGQSDTPDRGRVGRSPSWARLYEELIGGDY